MRQNEADQTESSDKKNIASDNRSDKASNEAQNELRRNNNLGQRDSKTESSNLPKVDFMAGGSGDSDGSSVSDVILLNGGAAARRILIETGDGRTSTIDYDANGKAIRYVDFGGNTYENQGRLNGDNQPDVWISTKNPVKSDGVHLDVDADSGTVRMTDRATQIVRSTAANGVETTEYPGGGKTSRQFRDGAEFIAIESKNRPLRTMKIQNDRLTQYTDGNGTTFTITDQKDEKGKPYYSAVDKNNQSVDGKFTITADRTGNAVVRDENHPESPNYARRELNNGTVITSTKANGERTVVNGDGQSLDPTSAAAVAAQESPVIAEVPPIDLDANARQANEHYTGGILFTSYDDLDWFYGQVAYGKPWDFKSPGPDRMSHPEYEEFGNWHYGYVGAASGYSLRALQEEAGYAQVNESVSRPEWGSPGKGVPTYRIGGVAPYGDDPRDQEQIRQGYEAYFEHLRKKQEQQQAA